MKYKIVHVKWMDAARQLGWVSEDRFSDGYRVDSVGVEVRNDKGYISIARDLDEDTNECARDVIHIPKGMIIKKRVLGTVERSK